LRELYKDTPSSLDGVVCVCGQDAPIDVVHERTRKEVRDVDVSMGGAEVRREAEMRLSFYTHCVDECIRNQTFPRPPHIRGAINGAAASVRTTVKVKVVTVVEIEQEMEVVVPEHGSKRDAVDAATTAYNSLHSAGAAGFVQEVAASHATKRMRVASRLFEVVGAKKEEDAEDSEDDDDSHYVPCGCTGECHYDCDHGFQCNDEV
jgi:hypothetical protein